MMSYDKVSQAQSIIIGTKQTVKALKRNSVKEVVVAKDADPCLTSGVINLANEQGVPVSMAESMKSSAKPAELKSELQLLPLFNNVLVVFAFMQRHCFCF